MNTQDGNDDFDRSSLQKSAQTENHRSCIHLQLPCYHAAACESI